MSLAVQILGLIWLGCAVSLVKREPLFGLRCLLIGAEKSQKALKGTTSWDTRLGIPARTTLRRLSSRIETLP